MSYEYKSLPEILSLACTNNLFGNDILAAAAATLVRAWNKFYARNAAKKFPTSGDKDSDLKEILLLKFKPLTLCTIFDELKQLFWGEN